MYVFEFKIAQVEESELPATLEAAEPLGSFKTLYAVCETEDEALSKVNAYVKNTKYTDIKDKKIFK